MSSWDNLKPGGRRECPFCAGTIHRLAALCHGCGRYVPVVWWRRVQMLLGGVVVRPGERARPASPRTSVPSNP